LSLLEPPSPVIPFLSDHPMKWIAVSGFLALAAAACATVLFVAAMKPTSATAFVLWSAWLLIPHAAMVAALILKQRNGATPGHWHAVAIVVCVAGVLLIADAIFWHPDAQGALAVMMVPLLQGIALALLLPLSGWAHRRLQSP
jgi:hypothetical protein